MQYLELSVSVRPEATEQAAGLLRSHVPSGVSIEPPFEAIDEEGTVVFDEYAAVRLRAWVPADGIDRKAALSALRRDLRALGEGLVGRLRARTVEDASWADAWKRHFPVLRVGRRLVVRPSWRRHRPRREDVVIELDPGMAFGTGQHATTRLCLEALEERLSPGARVLDVGAGSGILAIAAALLGAARVDAVDVDPVAVRSARENAERNGVGAVVRVAEGSLGEASPFDEPAPGRYDLVLANLSGRVVRELAGPLFEALAPDGVAIVSGVVAEQERPCLDALSAAGGRVVERRAEGVWRLLVVAR